MSNEIPRTAPVTAIKLSSPATREFWEIPVLFQDEYLLAVDKPAGLLTRHDNAAPERPQVTGLLHAAIADGKPWAKELGLTYLMPAHRLDAEASGVLLLAKTKTVLAALANLFGSEKVRHRYSALVRRNPTEDRFELQAKIGTQPMRPGRMRVDPRQGKRAHTEFITQEKFAGWTLLRCEPRTNRNHQVRVHLRHAGLPIVGDPLYGGRPLFLSRLKRDYRLKPNETERPLLGRLALHLSELSLPHPVSGEPLTISSPLPNDFNVALKYLRRFAPA